MHIFQWSARRSGPSMTVKGKADCDTTPGEGTPVTITNVKLIEMRGRMVVAVDAGGEEYILRTDH